MKRNEIAELREIVQAAEAIQAHIKVGIDEMKQGQNILADTDFQLAVTAYTNMRNRLKKLMGE